MEQRSPIGSLVFATVLVSDIVDSSSLAYSLPPDIWAEILQEYFQVFETTIGAHGGRLEKYIGDAVVAVFGVDDLSEDAASRAVSAGLLVLDRLHQSPVTAGQRSAVRTRMALASGYVAGLMQSSTFAVGDVATRAARMQVVAPPGEMVVDKSTWLQVTGRVKGEPMAPPRRHRLAPGEMIWRVLPLSAQTGATADDDPVPFVDRPELVDAIRGAIQAGRNGSGPRLIHVVGDVGTGKTRLVKESLGGRTPTGLVAQLQWPAHHSSDDDPKLLPLYHLLSVARQAERRKPEGELLDWSFGLKWSATEAENGPTQSKRDLTAELIYILRSLGRQTPLVLFIDDSHQVPAVIRELVDELVGSSAAELVIVTAGRPSPWVDSTTSDAAVIEVAGMTPSEAEELLAATGADFELHLNDGSSARAAAVGPGAWDRNPLYLVQLSSLRSTDTSPGILSDRRDFAPTAEAVIGARIGRLSPAAQRILNLVASLGCDIEEAVLTAMMEANGIEASSALAVLMEENLLVRHRDTGPDSKSLLSVSCLAISEVAYRRMSRRDRYANHLALAELLVDHSTTTRSSLELLVDHAWRALKEGQAIGLTNTELGRTGTITAEGAVAAARYLISRGESRKALDCVERASVAAGIAGRTDLQLDADLVRCYVAGEHGDFAELRRLSRAGRRRARAAGDKSALLQFSLNDALADVAERRSVRPGRIHALRRLCPPDQCNEAEMRLALLDGTLLSDYGRYADAERRLRHAYDLCRCEASPLGAVEVYANLSAVLAMGDTPVAEALQICRQLNQEVRGSELLRAVVCCSEGLLLGMSGDIEGAASVLGQCLATFVARDLALGVARTCSCTGALLIRCGDLLGAAWAFECEANALDRLALTTGSGEARRWAELLRWLSSQGDGSRLHRPELVEAESAYIGDSWRTAVRVGIAKAASAMSLGDQAAAADEIADSLAMISSIQGAGAVIPARIILSEVARPIGPLARSARDALATAATAKDDVLVKRYISRNSVPTDRRHDESADVLYRVLETLF